MKDWQVYRNGKPISESYKTISSEASRHELPLPKDEWQPQIDQQEDFKLIDATTLNPNYKTSDPSKPGNPTGIVPLVYKFDSMPKRNPSMFPLDVPTSELQNIPAVRIPKDYYLMIGDNRNGSNDSRYWGLVHRSQIVGRAEFTWMPISRAKKLTNPHAK